MSANNLNLVTREDGVIIQNSNGDVLIQNTSDGKLSYIKFEIATQIFKFDIPNVDSEMNVLAAPTTSPVSHADKSFQSMATKSTLSPKIVENTPSDRNNWSRSQILKLIEAYKNHKPQFQSTAVKNDKVWQMISAELGHHTTDQCSNKFKYLKAAYMKTKDNMSSKKTGAERIKFDYLEEFDAIFGNDANVKPIAIASSSKGLDNVHLDEVMSSEKGGIADDNCTVDQAKRHKRSLLENQLMSYESNIAQREQRREQQHKDKMERQDKATAALTKIADCFAIYVGKKRSNDDKEN